MGVGECSLLANVFCDLGGGLVGGGVVNGGFGDGRRQGKPDGTVAGEIPEDSDDEQDRNGQGQKQLQGFYSLQQVKGVAYRQSREQREHRQQRDKIMRAIVKPDADGGEGANEEEEGERDRRRDGGME